MAKLRMAHASTHGARKPPGPKKRREILQGLRVAQAAVTERWPSQKICIYLLVMPKYWVKNYFARGRFPEVGQKQKTEKKKRERERERKKD